MLNGMATDGKLMHAVQFNSYGGGAASLKHVEIGVPVPKKGEILIKLEAMGLNPIDYKIQSGIARPFLPPKFPHIPGSDITGEVVQVGSGVQRFKLGDKVVAILSNRDGGGLAEYAVAKESMAARRPPEVSAAEAAGLPLAALTAHEMLTRVAGVKLDGSGPRKNVLVTAASGGVGHYAVQLAKLGNAHVTATCGARNAEFVRSLGADEVLDYRTPEGASLASPSGKKYDVVVHCATGIPWCTFERHLSKDGKVVDITPSVAAFVTSAWKTITFSKKRLVPLFTSPNGERLGYLVGLVKEGKLRVVIDSNYPLRKAEDAWGKSIGGHATGKIVLEP
ncbi:hypothetical protein DM860_012037 [Cuscuta australis]|uniref:Enoyl reductase (ER) domain-containing protein n=1 Tax=Cuscuta australis TaxID=267555 RepID=A0A328D9U5_9ASTE|nr:hypothetical protein DM860_012037 [Cuscuta australis]